MRSVTNSTSKLKTARAAVVGAGLTVVVAAALAGCGQVRAGGTASGPGGRHAAGHSGAGRSPAGRSGGADHRSGGTREPAGQTGGADFTGRLCAYSAAVTSVRVVRIPSLAQISGTRPLPRQVQAIVVGDARKARQLAQAICSLPAMPHAVWQCPVVVGGGYVLEFMSGREQFHPVTVQASGCEPVLGTGAGGSGTRWVATRPGFWTTLAHLTGIQAPAHSP
jgi:hypothetical protein